MKTRRWQTNFRRTVFLAVVTVSLCLLTRAEPKYKVLHNFSGTDGAGPWGGVILDAKGNLYGTTPGGGEGNECTGGCGVVFELTQGHSAWTETVLHSFGSSGDGSIPYGGVALDVSGDIYGTTVYGGANNHGTVFELTSTSAGWTEAVLYSFCQESGCADGGSPESGPTLNAAGDLFGAAGVAYELMPSSRGWEELVLHDFTGESGDGLDASSGVILDADGNLYGTTQYGGIQCGSSSCGTVYELTPQSGGEWKETSLLRFNNKDGATPGWGALFMDNRGAFYGTTRGGGSYAGVVYKLMAKGDGHWKEAILYKFKDGASGYEPNAGVVMDKGGTLYGTTDYGGVGCGVIYKLAPKPRGKWKYTVLHTFEGLDGCLPEGNLVLDQKGNLYGGTVLGGATGNGVVFELTP